MTLEKCFQMALQKAIKGKEHNIVHNLNTNTLEVVADTTRQHRTIAVIKPFGWSDVVPRGAVHAVWLYFISTRAGVEDEFGCFWSTRNGEMDDAFNPWREWCRANGLYETAYAATYREMQKEVLELVQTHLVDNWVQDAERVANDASLPPITINLRNGGEQE